MPKRSSGIITDITSTTQSGEQPSRQNESQTVAAVFTHKITITVMGIRL